MASKKDQDVLEKGKPSPERQTPGVTRLRPGASDYMAGEQREFKSVLSPYLPHEMIGGSVPHLPGMEDEAVWNAASQACATERVHFCYSVDRGRVWYIACPSSVLASNPDSWCPLAAALPGNSEFWDKETVYLYEQEGVASALRWDPETGRMQIFLGAARTILPRIQSMDANFVTINPDVATVVPWKSMALRTEKLSRAAARILLLAGLAVNGVALFILIINFIIANIISRDLVDVKEKTEQASQELMMKSYSAMQSDTIKHIVRIQELLDDLPQMQGTLVRYEVKDGKIEWEALVEKAFSGGIGSIQGKVQPGLEKDGRVRIKGNK